MTTKTDIVEAAVLTRDRDGYNVERVFIVNGITGNATARLYNASIQPGIPQYGDSHPVIPGIQVTTLRVEPLESGETFRVTAIYSEPDDDGGQDEEEESGRAALSTSIIVDEVFKDINGEPLKAVYTWDLGVSPNTGRPIRFSRTEYATAQVERPQQRLTFKRVESTNPRETANLYLGRVNASTWLGYAPYTVLLSTLNAEEDGDKWRVEYSFSIREDTWRVEVLSVISQEEAESTPINTDQFNGYAVYDVYKTTNFNELGLSF